MYGQLWHASLRRGGVGVAVVGVVLGLALLSQEGGSQGVVKHWLQFWDEDGLHFCCQKTGRGLNGVPFQWSLERDNGKSMKSSHPTKGTPLDRFARNGDAESARLFLALRGALS